MSESRRRSTRRVKERVAYAVNDLVQITLSSGTTAVGRLTSKIFDSSPSSTGRWLCTVDDGPHRKVENLPEEALGAIVGHVDQESKNNCSAGESSLRGTAIADPPVTTSATATTANMTKDNKRISTRSHRRGNSNDQSMSGNSGSNTDEKSSKGGSANTTNNISSNKKKTAAFSTKEERGVAAVATLDAAVMAYAHVRKNDNAKIVVATAGDPTSSTSSPYSTSKVSDREQRSRRRQELSHDEIVHQQQYYADSYDVPLAGTISAAASSNSTSNKRSDTGRHGGIGIPGSSPKTKKSKLGDTNSKDGEVLSVKLLTGTLFLYRGAHRRAEFVPKY